MKKFLIGALILVAVIAMVKTVPDKKAHKNAMMEAVKAYVDEELAMVCWPISARELSTKPLKWLSTPSSKSTTT